LRRAKNDLARATTALEQAGLRERALHAELQHRVRNILAVVRSIFSRTIHAADDLEHVADHFRGRIDALGQYQIGGTYAVGHDLEDMVRSALMAYAVTDDPRIAILGPEVTLEHRAAEVIGLALHELATNSIKFGTLSLPEDRGRLKIEWRLQRDVLLFEWLETGIAIVAPAPFRTGFGRDYIEQGLPYQLSGETSFALTAGRFACTFSIPLGNNQNLAEP
jgi:two-component sensor histidine kinase